jgi:glycosyltransferase involved in cell wall biosynthesis
MTARAARSLRILYVGTLPPHQGGSAITGAQLLAGLATLGHEVEAISPTTEKGLRSGDRFAEGSHPMEVARFAMPYLRVSPDIPPAEGYDRRERREIKRLMTASIARRRPDAIMIGRESFAPHVVDLARAHGIPCALRFAGATTMGILNGTYPVHLAERLLECARGAQVAVTPAEHMQRTLARLGLARVRVIPNPVDLERFRPLRPLSQVRRMFAIGDEELVIAHISNLKALKRPLDFVEAAEIAGREDERLVFVVVGDGPYRAAIEQACGEAGIVGRFRFPGWIDYDLMPHVVNCADIIVLPSAGEAQARVYLETQACERTLIASDIPAAREVVDDDRTGMLYRTGDVSQLAAKILIASRDPDLRAKLGGRARKSVVSHSLPRVAALYAQLLGEIADDHSSI